VDFLLPPQRDRAAAEAFLRQALRSHELPEKITIDQRGSNTAAIERYNRDEQTALIIRQSKYLNKVVEQDHRAVKRLINPLLGFTSFWAARCTLAGIEVMPMIKTGQRVSQGAAEQTPAEQFYSLAA
jgi:putative transposase